MATHSFRDLIVWQRSMIYVANVYKITRQLPKIEQYALADQLRRAVISIPSNIAEGQKRISNKETIQFSSIALGSLAEVQTQLILVQDLYDIHTEDCVKEADEICRMLTALIKALRLKSKL